MAGAIIQLVAYGVQDLYLTGDPQITFFKIIYRRHTNFSIESVIQNFSSPANFGEIVTCTLSRVGDLVGQIMLYVNIPPIPKFTDSFTCNGDPNKKIAWVRYLGYALIQEITFEIGGKLVDRHYGEWLYLWEQLSGHQDNAIDKMTGNVPPMYDFTNGKNGYELYIPLKFWFCRHIGLALPLIAMASTDVKITVTFRNLNECIRVGPTHSIEVLDNVVPFSPGDYIEQTVNNQTIHGYFINFDYLLKKLYYIKIVDPNAIKQQFTSLGTDTTVNGCNVINTPVVPSVITDDVLYAGNTPYRIYNSINKSYCTPRPNATELVESVTLPYVPSFINSFLYVNYVYLDTDERLKFARSNHEYLIEQIQYNQELGIKSPNVKQNLNLDHPCKEHVWIAQLNSLVGPGTINDLFNYTDSVIRYPDGRFYGNDLVNDATLQLNGRDRFGVRESEYFNLVEPYQCHHRGPTIGINMYSFCLNPEDHQPSGTCNMSKIDYITMLMHLSDVINPYDTCSIRSYTTNYNVLRIFFNVGGLAFV